MFFLVQRLDLLLIAFFSLRFEIGGIGAHIISLAVSSSTVELPAFSLYGAAHFLS